MNSYPEIIAAGDKLLRERGLNEEARQVAALVVALAHRVQKDLAALPKTEEPPRRQVRQT